jgi:MFS family permease
MRKASLYTIFFTVFLDLVGFGLVVPYLPGVARAHGASDFVATLLGASYSLMQLLFVPFWGHLSDRVGRRPVLLGSIAATAIGMCLLGSATSLAMLFVARVFTGIATSNIAVAQAYIADVTEPEARSRGMGVIGASIGLGFIFGPVIGGVLEAISPLSRVGALPAYAAAGLSVLNLLFALVSLPESLLQSRRGQTTRSASPFDLSRFREAFRFAGVALAATVQFVVVLSMSGLEQTFRLFTEDAFRMSVHATGYVLGFVGVLLVLGQTVLLRRATRFASERTLIRCGVVTQAAGFLLVALSPGMGSSSLVVLYIGMGINALGSALTSPSLSAYVSRAADPQCQGVVLGVLQSAGAFARVCGPATGGLLYQGIGIRAPYFAAAIGMLVAGVLSLGLVAPSERQGRKPADEGERDGRGELST